MAGLLDANGRPTDPLLTPQQNMALHQQARQLIQTGLQQLHSHFQELFYKQALFIEYLTVKLQDAGIDIDGDGFVPWAEAKHKEMQEAQAEEDRKAAAQLVATGTPVQLED